MSMSRSCKYCDVFNVDQVDQNNFSYELCTEAIMKIVNNLTICHKSGNYLYTALPLSQGTCGVNAIYPN